MGVKREGREVWQGMVRLRVQSCLESICQEEGLTTPTARVRICQFAWEGGARRNMQLPQANAQGMMEAFEEGLSRFLDGRWQRGARGGKAYFTQSQSDWFVQLWEVGCADWDEHLRKPTQIPLVEGLPNGMADPLDTGLTRHARAGYIRSYARQMEGQYEIMWRGGEKKEEYFYYNLEELSIILDALDAIEGEDYAWTQQN